MDGIGPIDHLLNPTVGFAMPIRLAAVTLCYKRDLVCYKPRDQKKHKRARKVDNPRYPVLYSTPNSYRIRAK